MSKSLEKYEQMLSFCSKFFPFAEVFHKKFIRKKKPTENQELKYQQTQLHFSLFLHTSVTEPSHWFPAAHKESLMEIWWLLNMEE